LPYWLLGKPLLKTEWLKAASTTTYRFTQEDKYLTKTVLEDGLNYYFIFSLQQHQIIPNSLYITNTKNEIIFNSDYQLSEGISLPSKINFFIPAENVSGILEIEDYQLNQPDFDTEVFNIQFPKNQ